MLYCCAAVFRYVPYRRLQLRLSSPFLVRHHLANHSYRATHELPQHGSVNARCLEQLRSSTTQNRSMNSGIAYTAKEKDSKKGNERVAKLSSGPSGLHVLLFDGMHCIIHCGRLHVATECQPCQLLLRRYAHHTLGVRVPGTSGCMILAS